MEIRPTLEEVKELAALSGEGKSRYGVIPVSTEIPADSITPIEVLKMLRKISKHVFLLESAEADKKWGRYTFLGYDPTVELTCSNGEIRVKTPMTTNRYAGDPAMEIRKLLGENKSPVLSYLPPFTGGLVGYFAYDYIKYQEPTLHLAAEDKEGFQDVDFMLFHKVIAFDSYRQKVVIMFNIKIDDDSIKTSHDGSVPGFDYDHKEQKDLSVAKSHIDQKDKKVSSVESSYHKACLELENCARFLLGAQEEINTPLVLKRPFKPYYQLNEYCEMVKRAKEYIKEGDIFQVVLSNRLEAEMEGSLLNGYRVLRTTNPSPYMFFFSGSGGEIAGASPETLVKLSGKKLTTFPLAGTRPRGETAEEDQSLEQDLLSDAKELAEHNMLVDLGRNDLGKVCEIGSVVLEKYLSVERYSHVMHIGSTVSGQLREGYDAMDAVGAVLPAGTLSGAPKIRACEIIDELENNKRGVYGGAIGYFSFTGDMDMCIAIRLAFSKNGKVFIRSGAGIVADSVPEKEYEETLQKAAAVKEAILAGGAYDSIN
jgi:anthranilate synthase component 1